MCLGRGSNGLMLVCRGSDDSQVGRGDTGKDRNIEMKLGCYLLKELLFLATNGSTVDLELCAHLTHPGSGVVPVS